MPVGTRLSHLGSTYVTLGMREKERLEAVYKRKGEANFVLESRQLVNKEVIK